MDEPAEEAVGKSLQSRENVDAGWADVPVWSGHSPCLSRPGETVEFIQDVVNAFQA